MSTQDLIPKSELFEWLRQSVRRRENVALKIVTSPQRDTIVLRLSGGRLVYVRCEDHSPLDALVLLTECEQVQFTFTSVAASERRTLMSSNAFLTWLDAARESAVGARVVNADSMPRASQGRQWSGTLRGGSVRKGRPGLVMAVGVLVAVLGLVVTGVVLDDGSDRTIPGPTAGGASTESRAFGTERVLGPIVESTTWTTGRTYRLDDLVFVEAGARLLIEPGVTVLGGGPGAALIVTRDASIHARGAEDEPIVFTSAKPEGTRASGDWGGVVLLGNAPINRGRANVEEIPRNDGRGVFGGNDQRSNCGVLEYVRIEFAGSPIGAGNELNGLTLGGCGTATSVRHVQVHRAHEDAVEVLGGAVDIKYVLASHAGDDALDWDMGWTGRAQFLVVQHHPELGDTGFEGSNSTDDPDAEPISRPQIYNVTMVGSGAVDRMQHAVVIRNGSGGEFRNFLIAGFPLESIDLRGELTAERIASGALSFGSFAMTVTESGDLTHFADESGARDDDGGFDERRYLSERAPDIVLDSPPALGPEAWSLTDPDFTPVAAYIGAGSQWSPPTDEEFWDKMASYYGAVRYGDRSSWMREWIALPES